MNDLGIYRNLGSELISKGKWFLNKSTQVIKTNYFRAQILATIKEYTGLVDGKVYSADEYHHTTDMETWKTLIQDDWTNKKLYISEIFDCDNYAGSFSANMAEVYELNSAARMTVELVNPVTGAHIGWHRCCLIIDNRLDCWLLETQTDKIVKIEPGQPIVLDNWKYIPNYVDIN